MHLHEVKPFNRRDIWDFLNLPFKIYRDFPQWVPPLMPGERARFRADFPFYKHSEAVFYLVRDERGEPVGRVAVLEHRPHNEYRDHQDALLYLYEAIDDDAVAGLLFEAAAGWARSRGLDRLVGPKGFLTGDGLGLLVEGFEHAPAIGIPYTPPYYIRHWEQIGQTEKAVDYLSVMVSRESYVYPERVRQLAAKMRQRRNFRVPLFKTRRELLAYADQIQTAYNSAFADLWAYTPIPDGDMRAIVKRMLDIADPSMIKLIFKDDDLIGFQFAYPDISAGIRHINGRLWPLGWIVLLLERKRTKWLNINGNAILPQYQGLGANTILYDEMAKTLLDNHQFDYADLVQVQEDNMRMLADLTAMTGARPHKRHRVYHRQLD